MPWRFEPGERIDAAFRRVALEEVTKIRAALGQKNGDRVKYIHEARQGFKRMRALLRLAKPALGASAYAAEDRRWRDLGKMLSASRDAAVLAETFDRVASECGDRLEKARLDALRRSLNGKLAGPDLGAAAESVARVLGELRVARRALAAYAWPQSEDDLVSGFKRSQARLRKSWQKASSDQSPEALHAWRKRVKDQSAQLRLFRKILPGAVRKRREMEKALGEILGEDHDLWMLAQRLTNGRVPREASEARKTICDAIDARRNDLRHKALKTGERFSSEKPKLFTKSLDCAWADSAERFAELKRDKRRKTV